MDSDL